MARPLDSTKRLAMVAAAGELFYARGVAATAVDDVAAAAGVTKPTLYRYFPSKDALLAASLDGRHERLEVELRAAVRSVAPPRRAQAIIDWVCEWIADPGFQGCAFVRAYAELPHDDGVRGWARRRKEVLLDVIEEACRDGGAEDPRGLAAQLALIVEGATTMAFVRGEACLASAAARRLADVALVAAGVERGPTDGS